MLLNQIYFLNVVVQSILSLYSYFLFCELFDGAIKL